MALQQNHFQVPYVKFRVLIIRRANAGKTSILQRVCDTTESPKVYRLDQWGRRTQVHSRSRSYLQSHRLVRFNLTLQGRFDSRIQLLLAMADRDRDDRDCSVDSMILMTNSSLRNMMVMFSMTPVDSRLVVKMS